jgi:hypothetical protein
MQLNNEPSYLQFLGQEVGALVRNLQAKPREQRTARQAQIVATVEAHFAQSGDWHKSCIAYVRGERA